MGVGQLFIAITSRLYCTEKNPLLKRLKKMCDCDRSENIHDRLISIDQLIELLGEKSKQAVYNKLNRDVFPISTYKIGKSLRWKLSEVQDYIEKLLPIR